MRTVDYVIVGQGLAGTTLAHALRWNGFHVLILDRDEANTSSRIAGGLITPITGKRLVKSWHWDTLFPAAVSFYQRVERESRSSFFHLRKMVRLFRDAQERSFFEEQRQAKYTHLLTQPQPIPLVDSDWLEDTNGGIEMCVAGQLNVSTYLDVSRKMFEADSDFVITEFDAKEDLERTKRGVYLPRLQIQARGLIFCQGYQAIPNPWFADLPFQASKGEILTVRIPGLTEERIIHRGVWLLPLGEEVFRVGSTYEWDQLDAKPTIRGRESLTTKLLHLLKEHPFEILEHKAAVRPILQSASKPVLGWHPQNPQLGYFNGLGSKGSLLAPYFARQFAEAILGKGSIDPDVQLRLSSVPSTVFRPTDLAQDAVRGVLEEGSLAIDATAGNGLDTRFLAYLVGATGRVFALDIQPIAIERTAGQLRQENIQTVQLICGDHAQMDQLLPANYQGQISAIMFNLGYLPRGEKTLITQAQSTCPAIHKGLDWLRVGGVMTIVAYTGHPGGFEETEAVEQFLHTLSPTLYSVTIHRSEKANAPRLFVIHKR